MTASTCPAIGGLSNGSYFECRILEDDMAVALARVLASANKRARELSVDVPESPISVTQVIDNGPAWRVNNGPKDCVGRRGGDLIIEVDPNDVSIKQVLRGQ